MVQDPISLFPPAGQGECVQTGIPWKIRCRPGCCRVWQVRWLHPRFRLLWSGRLSGMWLCSFHGCSCEASVRWLWFSCPVLLQSDRLHPVGIRLRLFPSIRRSCQIIPVWLSGYPNSGLAVSLRTGGNNTVRVPEPIPMQSLRKMLSCHSAGLLLRRHAIHNNHDMDYLCFSLPLWTICVHRKNDSAQGPWSCRCRVSFPLRWDAACHRGIQTLDRCLCSLKYRSRCHPVGIWRPVITRLHRFQGLSGNPDGWWFRWYLRFRHHCCPGSSLGRSGILRFSSTICLLCYSVP